MLEHSTWQVQGSNNKIIYNNDNINNYYIYSFKIFLHFWLAKSTRRIHHNHLLLTKSGRILRLNNQWRQKCSTVAGWCTINREELGTSWIVLVVKRKGPNSQLNILLVSQWTIMSARRQRLVFGVYLQTWTALYLLNVHYQGERKHVLAMFLNQELFWMNNKAINEIGFIS